MKQGEYMMRKAIMMVDRSYDSPDIMVSSEQVAWELESGVLWIFFGGTDDIHDVVEDISIRKKVINIGDDTIKVHSGFWKKWLEVRDRVLGLIHSKRPSAVQFGGHSAGGSVAILAYLDMPYHIPKQFGIRFRSYPPITFGAAKVLASSSHSILDYHFFKPYLFQNQGDPVPGLPRRYMGFRHWGLKFTAKTPWWRRIYIIRSFTGAHNWSTYKKKWRNKKDIL